MKIKPLLTALMALALGLPPATCALAAAVGVAVAGPVLQQQFGITLLAGAPTAQQWGLFGAVLVAGMLASLVPGLRAYRLSLADGLSPKV